MENKWGESYNCSSLLSGEFPACGAGREVQAEPSNSPAWGHAAGCPGKPKQMESVGQRTGEERAAQKSKFCEEAIHVVSWILMITCTWGNYPRPGKEPPNSGKGTASEVYTWLGLGAIPDRQSEKLHSSGALVRG